LSEHTSSRNIPNESEELICVACVMTLARQCVGVPLTLPISWFRIPVSIVYDDDFKPLREQVFEHADYPSNFSGRQAD
jgi:hypothetical protein